jgi:hypothetical protein
MQVAAEHAMMHGFHCVGCLVSNSSCAGVCCIGMCACVFCLIVVRLAGVLVPAIAMVLLSRGAACSLSCVDGAALFTATHCECIQIISGCFSRP